MRLSRLILIAAALCCALLASGCGNRVETRTLGETEGLYLDIDELKYQIQISRYINPADIEDRSYLVGLPEGTEQPAGDETYFGVFIRVSNSTDHEITPANDFEIIDTQENVYRPVPLDPKVNPWSSSRTRSRPRASSRSRTRSRPKARSRARSCCSSSRPTRCRTARSSSASAAAPASPASSTSTCRRLSLAGALGE